MNPLAQAGNVDIDAVKRLVRLAFEIAKTHGKPDWQQMSVAVLKNRLLNLSSGGFDEKRFGAKNFTSFVQTHLGDVVQLHDNSQPARVELLAQDKSKESRAGTSHAVVERREVRPDLWKAAFDFSTGTTYGWDEAQALARAVEPGEDLPVLPTLTAEELAQWREEFAAKASTSLQSDAERGELSKWKMGSGSIGQLPKPLRKPWVQEMMKRVESRLLRWFNAQGLQAPVIISGGQGAVEHSAPEGTTVESTESLRSFVLACVKAMHHEELAALAIPAGILMRMRK